MEFRERKKKSTQDGGRNEHMYMSISYKHDDGMHKECYLYDTFMHIVNDIPHWSFMITFI